MIGRKKYRPSFQLIAMSFAIAALLGSAIAGTFGAAQALLVSQEEHWKYNVKWRWDSDLRKTVGLITPQIVIQNETASRLEGYIADANGTRLSMYDDGMQVVMAKFIGSNFASKWEIADRIHDGYFAIDIPERYMEAETVRIYIGNFDYTINARPQVTVFINSATTNYVTNSALEVTEVAQAEEPLRSIYDRGSLIDWILSRNGMLFVRSPDSGK